MKNFVGSESEKVSVGLVVIVIDVLGQEGHDGLEEGKEFRFGDTPELYPGHHNFSNSQNVICQHSLTFAA